VARLDVQLVQERDGVGVQPLGREEVGWLADSEAAVALAAVVVPDAAVVVLQRVHQRIEELAVREQRRREHHRLGPGADLPDTKLGAIDPSSPFPFLGHGVHGALLCES